MSPFGFVVVGGVAVVVVVCCCLLLFVVEVVKCNFNATLMPPGCAGGSHRFDQFNSLLASFNFIIWRIDGDAIAAICLFLFLLGFFFCWFFVFIRGFIVIDR